MTDARILLVESDAKVSDLLGRFLARSGHTVVDAASGAEALAALASQVFEVVILRMNLADGQAPAVLQRARAVASEPSVILSGSRSTADRFARAVDCVGAIFLVKPFTAKDLAQVMDDALAQHRMVIDSIPAEELDLDSIFDGPIDASLAPGPVDAFASGPPLGMGLAGFGLTPGDGLLPPPSVPPPGVVPPPPDSSIEGSLDGFDELDDPAETGDLLAGQVGLGDDDTGGLLVESGAGGHDVFDPAEDDFAVDAPTATPLPDEPDFGFGDDDPAPPRTSTQVLIREGQLFAGAPADGGTWDPEAIQAEAGQQAAAPIPEEEAQFLFRPMIGDSADDPRGIYGEISLPSLLVNCERDMFTGRLVLERGSVRKVVLVAGGRIIDTTSNLRSESLEYALLSKGRLSEADARRAHQQARDEHVELAHALVQLGLLTVDEVAEALAALGADRLLNCFTWVGGAYGVAYDPRLDQRAPAMQLAPLEVLVRGVMEVLPVGPMLGHFDSHARRGVRVTDRLSEHRRLLSRVPELAALSQLCDGRALAEVVAASATSMSATLRALRTLEYLQCVRFTEAGEPAGVGSAVGSPSAAAVAAPEVDFAISAPVRPEPATGGARRPTGERRIYRHSTGSLRGAEDTDGGRDSGGHRAITEAADGEEARRPSRSLRPVRDTSGRRSGVYRSGPTDEARASGPASAAPGSRRPSGSFSAVRRPSGSHPTVRANTPSTGSAARQSTGSHRPSPAPTRPVDVAAMKRKLQEKHAALSRVNHYELLEVATGATADDVRTAYQTLSKQMHQAAAHDQRLASLATEVGRRMAEAASVLSNRRQRAQYDAVHLSSAAAPALERDIEGAERAFDRGRTCLDRGDFPEAYDFFDQASRLAPDVALHRMYRAYAKFRLSYPKHRKAAVEAHDDLKKALLEDSAQDDGFVLMANIYRETGNVEMAVKFYRKALSLNRNNRAAGEALRVLTAGDPTGEDGSLFGRLFKR
ncbi:MAG: response regulator [Myxococcales bacterium]|nr:response regulator [Myxococcales bacterium]